MNITPEQYVRLSRFMDADMELSEMEAFEQELKANPQLRAQLDFEQSVRDGFAFKIAHQPMVPQVVTVALAHTGENLQPITIKKIPTKTKWLTMAIAATVLAAIVSVVYYQITKPKHSHGIVKQKASPFIKKNDTTTIVQTLPVIKNDTAARALNEAVLFAKNFTKDELPENLPMYLADALLDSDQGKEGKIQRLDLNNIGEIRGGDEKQEILQLGHYYKGISFLKTGNTKAAITNLKWVVLNSKDAELFMKAQWYLALAFLKNKEVDKGAAQLKKMVGKKNDYTERAKRLLKEIKG